MHGLSILLGLAAFLGQCIAFCFMHSSRKSKNQSVVVFFFSCWAIFIICELVLLPNGNNMTVPAHHGLFSLWISDHPILASSIVVLITAGAGYHLHARNEKDEAYISISFGLLMLLSILLLVYQRTLEQYQ